MHQLRSKIVDEVQWRKGYQGQMYTENVQNRKYWCSCGMEVTSVHAHLLHRINELEKEVYGTV